MKLLLLLTLLPGVVLAQAMPTVSLTCSPDNAVGTTPVTLTWTTTNAITAKAGGGWSGIKATSGTETLTGVATTRSYTLDAIAALGPMSVKWTAITQNQDGTPLTNLFGYKLYAAMSYGGVASAAPLLVGPTELARVLWLAPGTQYVGYKATTTTGIDGVMSNIVQKPVAASRAQASCTVTIATRPRAGTITLATN